MEIRTVAALPVAERSQVADARRVGMTLARALQFSEADAGRLTIIISELATNLLVHARDGELLLTSLHEGELCGAGVTALDRGPGIPNVAQCLRDGYSTSGSPGTGLGAVQRLSSVFDLYSEARGTAMLARVWPSAPGHKPPSGEAPLGAVSIPKPGQEVCGDAWRFRRMAARHALCVADGLGHGLAAAEAAAEALRVFDESDSLRPADLLDAMHAAMRHTRGAAVAVAEIDLNQRVVRFAGVGNISGVVVGPERDHSMVSHNGTLGHEVRKIQEFVYAWPEGGLLVMHSDGLSQRADVRQYPALVARHPGVIAGVLYRDFRRAADDSTVVVYKDNVRVVS